MAEDETGGGPGDDIVPESLMPYDLWIERAYREVMIQAIHYAAAEGLPGGHHFYITFRTDHPGVAIPKRLLTQYPHEMTIVLQHQFWDLKFDDEAKLLTVGLSFGSVPSTLAIPLGAITGFADPQVRLVLRFTPDAVAEEEEAPVEAAEAEAPEPPVHADTADADPTPQVVSLDAFRKRGGPG